MTSKYAVPLLGFCMTLLACASAEWQAIQRTANYVPPRRLFLEIDVTDKAAARNDRGQAATLVDGLIDELRARGVDASLADPESTRHYPRLKLLIQDSRNSSKAASYFVGPLAGSRLVLECSLLPAHGAAATFKGSLNGSDTGSSTSDSHLGAEAAAEAIAEAIVDPDS
jgi:hypothetical protein